MTNPPALEISGMLPGTTSLKNHRGRRRQSRPFPLPAVRLFAPPNSQALARGDDQRSDERTARPYHSQHSLKSLGTCYDELVRKCTSRPRMAVTPRQSAPSLRPLRSAVSVFRRAQIVRGRCRSTRGTAQAKRQCRSRRDQETAVVVCRSGAGRLKVIPVPK